jgi:hypothetical protein
MSGEPVPRRFVRIATEVAFQYISPSEFDATYEEK